MTLPTLCNTCVYSGQDYVYSHYTLLARERNIGGDNKRIFSVTSLTDCHIGRHCELFLSMTFTICQANQKPPIASVKHKENVRTYNLHDIWRWPTTGYFKWFLFFSEWAPLLRSSRISFESLLTNLFNVNVQLYLLH